MLVPSDTDRKYSATIWVWKRAGASLVVTDRPGGEMNISAIVKTKRMKMIARSGVEFGAPLAQGRNSRNATPMTIAPSANLTGADGCRVPSFVQMAANTPDRRMTKIGLMELIHEAGISQPR